MSVRRAIATADLSTLNVSTFCRDHGMSRERFYEIRRRYEIEGEAGLEPRSRAPKHVANRTSAEMEDAIVEIRKDLVESGFDAGPGTIAWHLGEKFPAGPVPAEATIWRILHRRGFITPTPEKAPKHAYHSFAAERANELWQLDSTDWMLANRTDAKIINGLDDCTRVCVTSRAVPSCTTEIAWSCLLDAAAVWGLPADLLSDNAREFVGSMDREGGLIPLLHQIGIGKRHARPYHPQTCGKVERFHQTLKKHLARLDPAETLDELQAQLDTFVHYYNHNRPHRSLNRQTPIQAWNTTPKDGPADRPISQPTRVLSRTVQHDGRVDAKATRISLGAAHRHKHVTIIITGNHYTIFAGTQHLRSLTANPNRTNQPLHNRPGRPTN